jgi:hypothetical protein
MRDEDSVINALIITTLQYSTVQYSAIDNDSLIFYSHIRLLYAPLDLT